MSSVLTEPVDYSYIDDLRIRHDEWMARNGYSHPPKEIVDWSAYCEVHGVNSCDPTWDSDTELEHSSYVSNSVSSSFMEGLKASYLAERGLASSSWMDGLMDRFEAKRARRAERAEWAKEVDYQAEREMNVVSSDDISRKSFDPHPSSEKAHPINDSASSGFMERPDTMSDQQQALESVKSKHESSLDSLKEPKSKIVMLASHLLQRIRRLWTKE